MTTTLDTSRIFSGFRDLDELTGGFWRSHLIVLASASSAGKTSLALNIARNVSANHLVAFFSLEMTKRQLLHRLISSEASVDSRGLRSPDSMMRFSAEEIDRTEQAVATLRNLPIYLDAPPSVSSLGVCNRVRRLAAQCEVGLIIVDCLHLLAGSENRTEAMSTATSDLKALAFELQTPVIAIAQLNQVEGRRPEISDLRESEAIEPNADAIALLHREAGQSLAEVTLAKNRLGPLGTIELLFEPQFTRFQSIIRRSN